MKANRDEEHIIGTSVFIRKNFAVQQAVRAGMWSSQTTFTSFHQRYVTHRSVDTLSMSPAVAAQQVM